MPALRLGLLGLGRWGRVYARTIGGMADRCRLSVVASGNPDAASLAPSAEIVAEPQAAIEGPCDGVIIATPPASHAGLVEACIRAGKPCLVEKPFCLDIETAERLHAQAERAGVPVLVGHTQLFNPAYEALRKLVEESGEPVRVIRTEGMALGPFREHTTALWDWGSHDVSLCLDLLGRLPRRVAALAGPRSPQGIPECVSLRLEFPDGAVAWSQLGSLSAEKHRTMTVFTEARALHCVDRGVPPLSAAAIRFSRRYAGGIPEPVGWRPVPVHDEELPMTRQLAYFVNGLAGGDRARFGTRLGCDVVRVLAAAEGMLAQERVHEFMS